MWSSTAAAQQSYDLFNDAAAIPAQDAAQEKGVVRARYVAVNFGDLVGAANSRSPLGLSLFSDAQFRAVIDSVEMADGASTMMGHLDGVDGSSVILVSSEGAMAGSITTPDAQYQIRYVGEGVHAIREFDVSQLAPELEPLVPEASMLVEPAADQVAADSGARFDLLVVYTAAARAGAGSTAAMRALINLGVTETNQAYANSGIIPRLRLVHMAEIAYAESGALGTDLPRLRGTADGFMDAVHALRNQYGADMVKLVVNNGDGCGIAYLMGPGHSTAFAPNAFSVTVRSCISPNYTFGHELGHNMGSNHAPIDPVGTGAFSYSYGYKRLAAPTFRTVMSYIDGCSGSCPRVLHFSNPARNYVISGVGYPTGTNAAWGPSTAQNNALSINNVRTSVANWRQEVPLVRVNDLWPVYDAGTANPPRAGEVARFWINVTNLGPNPLAASQRAYILIERSTGTNDTWIGSASIAGLGSGSSAWYMIEYLIPPNISGAWKQWGITWDTAAGEYTSTWYGPSDAHHNFNIIAAPAASAQVVSLWPVSGAQGGQNATLWARVWNNGSAALPADARVWFRVTGTGFASWVGSTSVAGLPSNATAWYSFSWPIPVSRSGAHQYFASVWRSGSTLISNIAGPQNFNIAAAPALAMRIESLWPIYNAVPGGNITMWAYVRNTGTAALPATARVHYWLNSEVGSTSVAGLASGAANWYSFNYTIPSAWVGGIYNYWAQGRNGATVLTSWYGPQRFTIGFNSHFTGSTAPWLAVRGVWSNASGVYYYTGGIASQYSSASYSTSTFTNQDVSARFWDNGANTDFTCIAVRGTPGTLSASGEWQNAYIFCYRRDGNYGVWKRVNHVWTALRGWTATGTVVQGSAWNLLRARAVGTSLSFWINGTLLYSTSDSSLASGRTAIWTYGSGGMWTDYVTLNSGNAVPDEMAADDAASDASAVSEGAAVSAADQAQNDAANKAAGGDDPALGVGASVANDRLPDRQPPSQ
jgi:hypothetical protein